MKDYGGLSALRKPMGIAEYGPKLDGSHRLDVWLPEFKVLRELPAFGTFLAENGLLEFWRPRFT